MPIVLQDIKDSIAELASRAKILPQRALAAWYAVNFFDLDEDDALEAASADGGNDQGIDLIFVDDAAEEIVVIQAHYPENLIKKTPKAKWDAVAAAVPFLENPASLIAAGRPDLYEQLEDLRRAHPSYTFSMGLITMGKHSREIEASVTAHKSSSSKSAISYFYLAQEDLLQKYQALIDAEDGIPEDDLQFIGNYFEDSGDYGRAYVGSITAAELQRLHKAHQDKLFAGNVRLFLGARKGGINEQIIKTAQTEPGIFWALNNGITFVADSVEAPRGVAKKSSTFKLKRFSIVNGCQTTSSLVKADAKPAAKVLARIIAAKANLKNEIVRYNNSQNAVKIWTVRAVDDIQESLRKEFQKVGLSYAPKQAGSRRKRNAQTIELDKVAQYLASSGADLIIQAIDNKSELFDEPYQKIFKRDIKAKDVYLAWLIGSFADEERRELAAGLSNDQNAGLLGVASTFWIVFCTYKILEKISAMGSPSIALDKMRSEEFQGALRKYVKRASSAYFDAAVDTYDRDTYGSFKSTLRSPKFLAKLESKVNSRILQIKPKDLPSLVAAAKSGRK